MIKVFGHLAPDTDTTCCAIIWAWHLNAHTDTPATPYVLGTLNKETRFVLERWNTPVPELLLRLHAGDTVAIVDTNNPQELPENIHETTITHLLDHHKLVGGLQTAKPLEMIIRPLASTASVIFEHLGTQTASMPREIKGLTLSCILSDTLAFRSPTTTPRDTALATMLADELSVSIEEYSKEMFAAKSDVSDTTEAELITLDSKKYAIGGKNFRVSVLETTSPDGVLRRKEQLIKAIHECVARESDIDDVLFFVVDIVREEATAFTYNELTTSIIEKSFGVAVSGDTHVLPGVISRKTQIIPFLKA